MHQYDGGICGRANGKFGWGWRNDIADHDVNVYEVNQYLYSEIQILEATIWPQLDNDQWVVPINTE